MKEKPNTKVVLDFTADKPEKEMLAKVKSPMFIQKTANNFFSASDKMAAEKISPVKQDRRKSPMKHDLQKIAHSPISIIDRMQLLSDDEQKEEDMPPVRNKTSHIPHDRESSMQTLQMLKDLVLFGTPLSQQQLKEEVQ